MDDMQMMPPMMPMQAPIPMSHEQSTIAGMRWNGDMLIFQLYKLLGDYEIKINDDGTQTFERINMNTKPKINDQGLQAIMGIIQSVVNPSVSLTKIEDYEAKELIKQTLTNLAQDIVMNQELWEISDENRNVIMSITKSVVFSQVKRAVEGHESTNFRTQTYEQNVQQSLQQSNNNGGFSFWKPMLNRNKF